MKSTSKLAAMTAMIRERQNNDFSPVFFTVADYRELIDTVTTEPVRKNTTAEACITYYTDLGYKCTVRPNTGEYPAFVCSEVIEKHLMTGIAVTFRTWKDALGFVRENFTELSEARRKFFS